MMFPHQGGPETNAQPYKVWGLPQVGTHGAARGGIQIRPKYSDTPSTWMNTERLEGWVEPGVSRDSLKIA